MLKNITLKKWFINLVVILCIITITLGLVLIIYNSTLTRLTADDYCLSGDFASQGGVFKAIWYEYNSWSGRYATILLVGISELFGAKSASFFSTALIILWVGGLSWLISETSKLLQFELPSQATILLAEIAAFFAILLTPDRFQSVYWRTGSATYLAPLVMLTYLSAFTIDRVRNNVNKRPPTWEIVLVFITTFLTGGFSETTLTLQIGLLGLGFLTVWFLAKGNDRRVALILLTSALVGSIASFIVVFLAPGNAIRQSLLPEPPQPLQIILLSFRFAAGFLQDTLKGAPIPNLFSLIIPALVVYILHDVRSSVKSRQPTWIAALAVPVIAYLLVVSICASSVYAESAYPEARALLPAQFILTGALVAEGALFGSFFWQLTLTLKLRSTYFVLIGTFLLGLSALYPLRMAKLITAVIPEYRERALLWDQRDEYIRTASYEGIVDVEVKALDSFGGLMELGSDPKLWVNRCAAVFYGINSITATSP